MTDTIAAAPARSVDSVGTEIVAITNAQRPGLDREPLRRGAGRARPARRDRARRGGRERRLRHRLLRRPRARRGPRDRGRPGRRHRRGGACTSRRMLGRSFSIVTTLARTMRSGRAPRAALRLRRASAAASTPARCRCSSWTTRARTRAGWSSTTAAAPSSTTRPTRSCSAAPGWPTSAATCRRAGRGPGHRRRRRRRAAGRIDGQGRTEDQCPLRVRDRRCPRSTGRPDRPGAAPRPSGARHA